MVAEPPVTILGERVALGPERADLLPTVRRWLDDFTLRRTQGGPPLPWSHEAMAALYAGGDDGGRRCAFVIYRRADWRPLGFTAWQGIDRRGRTAEFVIGIGEAACRGRGYGTETTRLMLDYAFAALGLHSAMLTVYATNPAGLRAYTRAGFRECGRRRQSHWQGGRLWDTVYMECLARVRTHAGSAERCAGCTALNTGPPPRDDEPWDGTEGASRSYIYGNGGGARRDGRRGDGGGVDGGRDPERAAARVGGGGAHGARPAPRPDDRLRGRA